MHDCIYDNQRAILIQYICNKCNRFNHLISNKQQNQSKMKNLFAFLTKIATIIIVAVSVYITPAVMAMMIFMDINVYMSCVTSPAYAAMMIIMSLFTTIAYVDWVIARQRKKQHMALENERQREILHRITDPTACWDGDETDKISY